MKKWLLILLSVMLGSCGGPEDPFDVFVERYGDGTIDPDDEEEVEDLFPVMGSVEYNRRMEEESWFF